MKLILVSYHQLVVVDVLTFRLISAEKKCNLVKANVLMSNVQLVTLLLMLLKLRCFSLGHSTYLLRMICPNFS